MVSPRCSLPPDLCLPRIPRLPAQMRGRSPPRGTLSRELLSQAALDAPVLPHRRARLPRLAPQARSEVTRLPVGLPPPGAPPPRAPGRSAPARRSLRLCPGCRANRRRRGLACSGASRRTAHAASPRAPRCHGRGCRGADPGRRPVRMPHPTITSPSMRLPRVVGAPTAYSWCIMVRRIPGTRH